MSGPEQSFVFTHIFHERFLAGYGGYPFPSVLYQIEGIAKAVETGEHFLAFLQEVSILGAETVKTQERGIRNAVFCSV